MKPTDSHPSFTSGPLVQALERLGGDLELLQELARMFVEDAPGLRADAQAELDRGEYAEAAATLHRLKGLVVTFDTEQVGPKLQELIDATREKDQRRVAHLTDQVQAELDGLHAQLDAII